MDLVPYQSDQSITVSAVTLTPWLCGSTQRPAESEILTAWLDEKTSAETKTAYERITDDFLLLEESLFPLDENYLHQAVKRFMETSKRTGMTVSVATKNQRLACLKSFYVYCLELHYIAYNPLARMKALKGNTSPHAAYPLADEKVAAGLASIDTRNLSGQRDKLLLVLMLETSKRVSEVRLLKWSDIREQAGKLRVTFVKKGGNVEQRTLSDITQKMLYAYQKELRRDFFEHGIILAEHAVFPAFSNRSYGEPLSIYSVSQICERYLGESRVHALRHTSAIALKHAGADVNDIRKALGHASLAHTITYLEEKDIEQDSYTPAILAKWGID